MFKDIPVLKKEQRLTTGCRTKVGSAQCLGEKEGAIKTLPVFRVSKTNINPHGTDKTV